MSGAPEAHINGNCWPDTCTYCSREPRDLCETCDGTGEVEWVRNFTERTERCPDCLGTGRQR